MSRVIQTRSWTEDGRYLLVRIRACSELRSILERREGVQAALSVIVAHQLTFDADDACRRTPGPSFLQSCALWPIEPCRVAWQHGNKNTTYA
jgi:hypothetical protein